MDLDLYASANAAFVELIRQAQSCRGLFEESGGPVPEPLRAFVGGPSSPTKSSALPKRTRPTTIVPPSRPTRQAEPPGAKERWISVPVELATVATLALADVRSFGVKTLSQIQDDLRQFQNTVPNSVYNAVNRLVKDGKLDWDGVLYTAKNHEQCPLLFRGYVWGLPETLAPVEIAAYRREVELALIKANPGLATMPAVRTLSQLKWFPERFNKDTFKSDISALLKDRKIKREGRGWALEKEVPSKEKTS